MKFGIRMPSLKRRFAARTSWKRIIRHRMGLKAPRGFGLVTNPKRFLYNKIYNKTSISVDRLVRKGVRAVEKNNKKNPVSLSFVINATIFFVLLFLFFPLAFLFLGYKLYRRWKNKKLSQERINY